MRTRRTCLNNLVTLLSCDYDGFEVLRDKLDPLRELFEAYDEDPQWKHGKHNAVGILIELIERYCPEALGCAGMSRNAMRARFADASKKFFSSMKDAES